MKIETKYDVGQHVYPIAFSCIGWEGWDVYGLVTVQYVAYRDCVFYAYLGKQYEEVWAKEDDCFLTEADAQAECERRNASG